MHSPAHMRRELRTEASRVEPNPTLAQKESGTYRKGHVSIHGLQVALENPKGGTRSGVGADGKPWSVTMPAHYGDIKRTEGADGDSVDVYIGEQLESPDVFVVNQVDAETRAWDEHKAMLGFRSLEEATATYDRGFNDGKGPQRRESVIAMPVADFKRWLKDGDTTKPLEHVIPAAAVVRSDGQPYGSQGAARFAATRVDMKRKGFAPHQIGERAWVLIPPAPKEPLAPPGMVAQGLVARRGRDGMETAAIRDALVPIVSKWIGQDAPKVTVAKSAGVLPQDIEAPEGAEALYVPSDGRIYLIADRIYTADHARRALAYETAIHHGIPKLLGEPVGPDCHESRGRRDGAARPDRTHRERSEDPHEADCRSAALTAPNGAARILRSGRGARDGSGRSATGGATAGTLSPADSANLRASSTFPSFRSRQ